MRAALLACLLAVVPLAGCMDDVRGLAPVVFVTHAFEATGEGSAPGWFGLSCEMARYEADPPRVTMFRPQDHRMSDLDFIVLSDIGDSWRAANRTAEAGFTLLAAAAGSGGGPLPWMGGSARGSLGVASVFREAPQEGRMVEWDGERARYMGEPLEEGVPATHEMTYDVRTVEGGTLRVKETLRVTYLGKVPVTVEDAVCSPRGA